jgi:hypothetical protein
MTSKLKALVDRARNARLTHDHKEEQRRSFAFGNTNIENELITREMVENEADALDASKQHGESE